LISFEIAGPRKQIFHDPQKSKAAIITCGGLCPGLNNVIRSLVMQLWYQYGIHEIFGFRYGYEGLNPVFWHEPLNLTPDIVNHINYLGGTILGSSRGDQDVKVMVNTLEKFGVNLFFPIGGDGTLRGAMAIANEIRQRGSQISVVGIPKTIDNDISFVAKSFGFETAFSIAVDAIASASAESEGAYNGIGLVKLMGRHSGYVAACAALALKEVNFILIPEVDFDMEGKNGLLEHLKKRLERRHHAVIVVAEGAGQKYVTSASIGKQDRDASGNLKLGDIGLFLKEQISEYIKTQKMEFTIKYIDPSYMIRSVPANASDSIFTGQLAQNAVHAAMAGKTNMLVATWSDHFVNVPIPLAISKRKVIDPDTSPLWRSVLDSTGQPAQLLNKS
jgi:6-phosphofructokinase 1